MTGYDPVYAKRWRLDRSRGILRSVDAAPVRVHIEALAMAGASYRAIADRAGLSVQAVTHIRDGQRTTGRATARAILGVTYESLFQRTGHEDFVPNVGARRRIKALLALGHSADTIAASVGRPRSWVYNTLHGPGQWHSRDRYETAKAAYAALSMTPGASAVTRSRAVASGYHPPLAWDDEDLDDPYAAPHLGDDDLDAEEAS